MTRPHSPGAPSVDRPLRVVVADDHPVCAELVLTLLQRIQGEVVGVAQDGLRAVALCEEHQPELLLLDVVLPKLGGIEVVQRIRAQRWPIKVILFTGSCTTDVLREALPWGIEGCLLKTSSIEEITAAIRSVRDGQTAFGPEASEVMRQLIVAHDDAAALTDVETAVLRQIAEGRAVKEMAAELSLSESGVYKVVDRVKRKVRAQSLQELTLSAVRRRLVAL